MIDERSAHAAAPALATAPAPRSRTRAWSRRHWVAVVLVAVSLLYSGAVTMLHGTALSPIDEVVYADYTYKAVEQGLVHEGEKFGDDVANAVGCNGVVPFGNLDQDCNKGGIKLKKMPNEGYTTGAAYTPVYFWITRVVGDGIHALTGIDQLTSWRLTGALWLSAGMLAFIGLLRRWKIPNVAILAVGLAFIASPFAWWTYTYISTDVSLFLLSSLMLSATTDAIRGRRTGWWLLPIGVAAVLFKITAVIPLGLAVLYLLVHFIADRIGRRRAGTEFVPTLARPRATMTAIISSVVVSVLVLVTWMRVFPLLRVSNHVVDQGIATPLTKPELIRLTTSALGGVIGYNPAVDIVSSIPLTALYAPLTWLTVAGVVGSMMAFRWDPDRGPIIWATGICAVLSFPVLAIAMVVTSGTYFSLPGRYGAGLLAAFLLVTAFLLRNRFFAVLVAVMGVGLMGVGLVVAEIIGAKF